jgi:hypothetical protein
MRRVTVALPTWIGTEEAQAEVVRDLCTRALLKVELYRSKMKPFEAKYRTTFARFRRRVEQSRREDCAAWDDLLEWEAAYTAHREWTKRYRELRQWSEK